MKRQHAECGATRGGLARCSPAARPLSPHPRALRWVRTSAAFAAACDRGQSAMRHRVIAAVARRIDRARRDTALAGRNSP